jgi:hypothetical protein
VLAKPATATIQTQMPYLTDISDQLLARILHSEWPHEQVLAALDVQNVKHSSTNLKSTHEHPRHLAEVLLAAQVGCIVR